VCLGGGGDGEVEELHEEFDTNGAVNSRFITCEQRSTIHLFILELAIRHLLVGHLH
jgi:hypothetical protein